MTVSKPLSCSLLNQCGSVGARLARDENDTVFSPTEAPPSRASCAPTGSLPEGACAASR
ncbi:hypothetical protein EMIT0P228_10221 [Pseudomonas brassicacearum]